MKKEERFVVILNNGVEFYIHHLVGNKLYELISAPGGVKNWQLFADEDNIIINFINLNEVSAIIREEDKR